MIDTMQHHTSLYCSTFATSYFAALHSFHLTKISRKRCSFLVKTNVHFYLQRLLQAFISYIKTNRRRNLSMAGRIPLTHRNRPAGLRMDCCLFNSGKRASPQYTLSLRTTIGDITNIMNTRVIISTQFLVLGEFLGQEGILSDAGKARTEDRRLIRNKQEGF